MIKNDDFNQLRGSLWAKIKFVSLFLHLWAPLKIIVLLALYMKNISRKVDLTMCRDVRCKLGSPFFKVFMAIQNSCSGGFIQYWHKEFNILFCSITPTNLGQFSKPGADLNSAGPDFFKTPPSCTIWPSFAWDIWG